MKTFPTGSIPVPATVKVAKNQRLTEDLNTSRTVSRTKRSQRLLEIFKIKYSNMLTSSVYKPAKLYCADKDTSKEWFVYYYYLKPGAIDQYKRFKVSLGMNREKCPY